MAYMLIFLLKKKMWVAFHIFVSKNTCELEILYLLEQLTIWPLTSSLSWRCFEQLGPDHFLGIHAI